MVRAEPILGKQADTAMTAQQKLDAIYELLSDLTDKDGAGYMLAVVEQALKLASGT